MKLSEISPRDGYRLFLRYDDGACGEVDLSGYAGRGVFAAWLQPGVFEQVTLAEAGHPQWPGEIDLCPDALYMLLTGKSPEAVFPTLRQLPVHA
ncbi:MAG: DUF2442 domain-containing protein [Verrucomicrobia bacterium]|nr:MAG: DUF2442 domain-containing protein [Verrucomicrobiota bacterium]